MTTAFQINQFAFSLVTAAILLSAISVSADQVIVDNKRNGTRHAVPAVKKPYGVCVSLPHLAEAVGCTWKWEMANERLVCTKDAQELVVIQGIAFADVAGTKVQVAFPPFRDGGSLYLHGICAAEVFDAFIEDSVKWVSNKIVVQDASVPEGFGAAEPQNNETSKATTTIVGNGENPLEITGPRHDRVSGDGQRIKTVVIDPGHGGKDPGAVGPGGVLEKDVVLGIALAVRDYLRDSTDLEVHLTREEDVFIPLRERTQFANDKKADLFISIHANSIGGSLKRKKQTRGYKVYFLSQAKNEADKLVAMKENSVIELEENQGKGNYLQTILIEMAANEYLTESQDMSIMIAEAFGTSLSQIGKLHTGVGQAPFWVLNGAYMPSVLVETAFISNPIEEKYLASAKVQKNMGKAIFQAIRRFKQAYEAEL